MTYKNKESRDVIMSKKDMNNNKENKWLVVPRKTLVDKVRDVFSNIIRMLKKETNNKSSIEKINTPIVEEDVQLEKIEDNAKFNYDISEKMENDVAESELQNSEYYKTLYKGMNDGRYTVADLSPSEFLTVMKMQKVEHEFTVIGVAERLPY